MFLKFFIIDCEVVKLLHFSVSKKCLQAQTDCEEIRLIKRKEKYVKRLRGKLVKTKSS